MDGNQSVQNIMFHPVLVWIRNWMNILRNCDKDKLAIQRRKVWTLLFVRNARDIILQRIVEKRRLFVTCADPKIIGCLNASEQNALCVWSMDIWQINVQQETNGDKTANVYIILLHETLLCQSHRKHHHQSNNNHADIFH